MTVQGPVKKQQPDGMSHGGAALQGPCSAAPSPAAAALLSAGAGTPRSVCSHVNSIKSLRRPVLEVCDVMPPSPPSRPYSAPASVFGRRCVRLCLRGASVCVCLPLRGASVCVCFSAASGIAMIFLSGKPLSTPPQ